MGDRVLVTYATWGGTTRGVAEAIADTLRESGAEVDLLLARDVAGVSGYRAAVIGGPVHGQRLHGEVSRLLKRQRQALAAMPVAYFVVCLTMKEDTPENRCQAEAFLDKVRQQVPEIKPFDVGLFAGGVLTEGPDFERLSLPMKWIQRSMASIGDVRDWDAVRTWAAGLAPKLS